MRQSAGFSLVFTAAFVGWSARAVERTEASPAPKTTAVAVFPDVVPGAPRTAAFPDSKPEEKTDPSLELLATNPYEAELAAALARQNLYGDDFSNPYAEEVRLANPYTDELRLSNPYSGALAKRDIADVSLTNPYTRVLRAPPATVAAPLPRAAPPSQPGTLAVDVATGFSGAVFVDGVGVAPGGPGIPVFPGSHTVTVYPAAGTPFSVTIGVPPGSSKRVQLGR